MHRLRRRHQSVARRKVALRRPRPATLGASRSPACKAAIPGIDIHRGRGNAVRILGRVLQALMDRLPLAVADINGGSKRNAIPREAPPPSWSTPRAKRELRSLVAAARSGGPAELGAFDAGLRIGVESVARPAQVVAETDATLSAGILASQHHGVLAMSPDIAGLVQTSTNLAIVATKDGEVEIETSQRSPIESSKLAAARMVATVFDWAGFE